MKKKFITLVFFALIASSVFAQVGISAGAGMLFDANRNNGYQMGNTYVEIGNRSIGGFVFFDATYVQADINFSYGMLRDGGRRSNGDADITGNVMHLGFSIFGKYPITFDSRRSEDRDNRRGESRNMRAFFPMLGVSYNMVLSQSLEGESADGAGDGHQFGILPGIGFDFGLSDNLFLRAEALAHIRFPSTAMRDAPGVSNSIGVGPRIKVGMGYRF
jgi:opacity protein-like surface antigen